jgi:2TM domain-containing protein
MTNIDDRPQLRDAAVKRLRKKRELQAHLLAYAMVNLFLVGLWYFTMPGGFFWPLFPIFGWGIGLAFHVWDVFSPETFTDEQVAREMRRLGNHTPSKEDGLSGTNEKGR